MSATTAERKQVTITTDGACLGNGQDQTRAAAAAILEYQGHKRAIACYIGSSTNQRAEINAAAFALSPGAASRDDESLTERMRVPCSPRAGLESYAGTLNKCGIRCLKKRIDPYGASEPIGWPLRGRLRACRAISAAHFRRH